MASPARGDLFARFIGILVFLLGLGIILGVLSLAFDMYRDPHLGVAASPTVRNAADIGIDFGRLIFRIALLFLGSISGSLISNKGIRLYFAALPNAEQKIDEI